MDYSTPRNADCPACGAPITLVMAAVTGKVNALDRIPGVIGNVAIIRDRAVYERRDMPLPEGIERYVSHFATCENPDTLRAELAQLTKENNLNAARGSWE